MENCLLLGLVLFLSSSLSFSIEISSWCDSSNGDRILEHQPHEDSVMIDGVFSVRRQVEVHSQAGPLSACILDLPSNDSDIVDSFHLYGLEHVQAFIFAIHLANQNASGTTSFGYRIRDSCGQIPGQQEFCPKPNSLATVLGPFWGIRDEINSAGRLDGLYNRFSGDGTSQLGVVMSGLDEEPASGGATNPTVVYLQQSCAAQGQVAVDFLLEAKWQFVSVIGSADSCGVSSLTRFYERAKELNVGCKLTVSYYNVERSYEPLTDRPSVANFSEEMDVLKLGYSDIPNSLLRDVRLSPDQRVAVVLLTNKDTAYEVLRQLKVQKIDVSQFVFFFGDFWGNPDALERLDCAMRDYLMANETETVNVKLRQHQKGIERFQDYLTGLNPYSSEFQENTWLRDYLEGFYNCSIADRTCRNSDTWLATRRSLFRNHYTSLIIDAVLTIAGYCETANCDVKNGLQPQFDITRFHPDFTSWTGNRVRFTVFSDVAATAGVPVKPLLWTYDILGFSPTSDKSDFNITNLGCWSSQRERGITTLDVQTNRLWKPSSFALNIDCYPRPSLFVLFLPSIVVILAATVSCGFFMHKTMLPAILQVLYTDAIAIVGSLAGLVLSVLVAIGAVPIGDCEDLRVDFAVTVICTACFASVLVGILVDRWSWCDVRADTERRCHSSLRYINPAALLLSIIAGQVALSAFACMILNPVKDLTLDVDSACSATRNHATFHVACVYSALVCLSCALASLLPPVKSQSYLFRYHTWIARISLMTLSLIFLSLVASYLVVDMYSVQLSVLSALAAFPGLFVSVIGLAIFIHLRWCYVHFATKVPIIIELIDPLMARTADVFSNKYANTMRSLAPDDDPRRATMSRCFPFQLRDQDLINQVRPVFIYPDRIAIGEYIGGGNFGQVFNGTLDGTRGVALKTLKGSFSAEELEDFLKEGLRMKDFDHPNVMQLIGIGYGKVAVGQERDSSVDVMPVVVLPYMAMGDLKRYLTDGRPGRARHNDVSVVCSS